MSDEVVESVKADLRSAFQAATQLLDAMADEDEVARARSTEYDPVLKMLEPVFEGHVGPPMLTTDRETAVKEGQRRAAAGEPPGFADARKADIGSDGAAGDYLVWAQTLNEAEKRKVDVLFVTGDVKRDWWRYEGSAPRGPRVELVRELHRKTGTRLFMLRPDRLLTFATALSVRVEQSSVANVERATRTNVTTAPSSDESGSASWDHATLAVLLDRLARVAPVQEAVLRYAARNNGYAARSEVYRIGEYEPGRQLKGFTRPVNRLVQEMRDTGDIPAESEDVLVPVYDEGHYGFGWVDGYRVPLSVSTIVLELRGTDSGK